MFTFFLYGVAIIILIVSYLKDAEKTKRGVKKAVNSFLDIFPILLTLILLMGFALTLIEPETISRLIGEPSGVLGIALASIIGAITLIPAFVAFPLAGVLLDNGAAIVPITAFVSTLMMVGIITLPLEIKYFGKKASYTRNLLAFVFSILIALIMGLLPWIF